MERVYSHKAGMKGTSSMHLYFSDSALYNFSHEVTPFVTKSADLVFWSSQRHGCSVPRPVGLTFGREVTHMYSSGEH